MPEETIEQRPGLIDVVVPGGPGETGPVVVERRRLRPHRPPSAWGLDNIEGSDEKPAQPSIFWPATTQRVGSQPAASYRTATARARRAEDQRCRFVVTHGSLAS